MNNYSSEQTSLTTSNVVIYGMLASQILASGAAYVMQDTEAHRLIQTPYETYAALSSYDQISNVITGDFESSTDNHFIEAVSTFYAKLIENQEPLGAEFEQVLNENLWNLYEV